MRVIVHIDGGSSQARVYLYGNLGSQWSKELWQNVKHPRLEMMPLGSAMQNFHLTHVESVTHGGHQ